MNTPTRLGTYGVGLAIVFAGAFVAADAVVPQGTVDNWTEQAQGHEIGSEDAGHAATGEAHGGSATETAVPGVASAARGFLLSPVTAPLALGEEGRLSFRIIDPDGEALTRFAASHERRLHLIVVRTDGTQFRHVHPTMAADGTWSLPWEWSAAGTYRVYADFVPETGAGASTITLTRTVDVAGRFEPVAPEPTRTASVAGFDVELAGDVIPGAVSHLTLTVTHKGEPVTTLEPYLGAFGHLVALREGDLAYLHVHPEGEEASGGDLAGPDIEFAAEMPTPGRYLLYLDFQVEGQVHTAAFVVDTDNTASPVLATGQNGRAEQGARDGSGDAHDH